MAGSPDRLGELDQKQLARDHLRMPLWYGLVCGDPQGGLDERKDFLVCAGGFEEAKKLILQHPLGPKEVLPPERTFYIPPYNVRAALNDVFGPERQVVRVMNTMRALVNPHEAWVVMPCNSQRWLERVAATDPAW